MLWTRDNHASNQAGVGVRCSCNSRHIAAVSTGGTDACIVPSIGGNFFSGHPTDIQSDVAGGRAGCAAHFPAASFSHVRQIP